MRGGHKKRKKNFLKIFSCLENQKLKIEIFNPLALRMRCDSFTTILQNAIEFRWFICYCFIVVFLVILFYKSKREKSKTSLNENIIKFKFPKIL